jgi:hypothetical protein
MTDRARSMRASGVIEFVFPAPGTGRNWNDVLYLCAIWNVDARRKTETKVCSCWSRSDPWGRDNSTKRREAVTRVQSLIIPRWYRTVGSGQTVTLRAVFLHCCVR